MGAGKIACCGTSPGTLPEIPREIHLRATAAPSRVERYRKLNEAVGGLAGRINQRFAHDDYVPIIMLRSS